MKLHFCAHFFLFLKKTCQSSAPREKHSHPLDVLHAQQWPRRSVSCGLAPHVVTKLRISSNELRPDRAAGKRPVVMTRAFTVSSFNISADDSQRAVSKVRLLLSVEHPLRPPRVVGFGSEALVRCAPAAFWDRAPAAVLQTPTHLRLSPALQLGAYALLGAELDSLSCTRAFPFFGSDAFFQLDSCCSPPSGRSASSVNCARPRRSQLRPPLSAWWVRPRWAQWSPLSPTTWPLHLQQQHNTRLLIYGRTR